MGTYEKKVNQLKDLMVRKYKSAYDKSKGIDIDISSIMYLPVPNEFNDMDIENMYVILDKIKDIIDNNRDKLKNPTAPLVYIYMIRSGRKDMARYVVLFGRCVTII